MAEKSGIYLWKSGSFNQWFHFIRHTQTWEPLHWINLCYNRFMTLLRRWNLFLRQSKSQKVLVWVWTYTDKIYTDLLAPCVSLHYFEVWLDLNCSSGSEFEIIKMIMLLLQPAGVAAAWTSAAVQQRGLIWENNHHHLLICTWTADKIRTDRNTTHYR